MAVNRSLIVQKSMGKLMRRTMKIRMEETEKRWKRTQKRRIIMPVNIVFDNSNTQNFGFI